MNKDLIGKKVKGFKFKDSAYSNLHYNPDMDECIGKVGVIKYYKEHSDSYWVEFDNDNWEYPAALIEKYLVENEKQNKMKITIKKSELKEIYDVACDIWQTKIAKYATREPFGDTVDFTEEEVFEMFRAATSSQLPVLNKIFGEREEKIDFDKIKTGSKVMLKHTGQHCTGIDNIDLKVPVDVVFYKTPHIIDGYSKFKPGGEYFSYCTFHQNGKFVLFAASENVDYIVKVIEY
jgi:hypothetical protein